MVQIEQLSARTPSVSVDELLKGFYPSPRFGEVSFASYRPDPSQPSQSGAVTALQSFATGVGANGSSGLFKKLFGKKDKDSSRAGIYLDGGFGVGKTHLLASLWHAAPGPKAFGTFVEYTNLVGALSFRKTVEALSNYKLVCIDEFELDDPGDTMLISRLLAELTAQGVSIAATSNTLPGQLGEGRFAAQDFLREIRKLASVFDTIRVDGPDYRHRDLPPAPDPRSDADLVALVESTPGATLDDFDALCEHLSTLHPSKYKALVDGVSLVGIRDVHPAKDQSVALRLVVLADRLYDADIPVTVSGGKLDEIFTDEMLAGGYRKKYLRATSRLLALSRSSETAIG